jgi:hypothetical protein
MAFLIFWIRLGGQKFAGRRDVVSCKQGTQDVCTVNKVRKYHSMCEMLESVHAAVETQRRVFC